MQEYPLQWPLQWTRTTNPKSSQFKTKLATALQNVKTELRLFAENSKKPINDIVISSNVTLGAQNPKDAGVAIYFEWDGIETCIAVDRYKKVEENLQAIKHCIEAERTKLRHGGLNLVRASFQGYAAIAPPDKNGAQWRSILGYEENHKPTAEHLKSRYISNSKAAHPDNGGNNERMAEVNNAYSYAKKELGY